MQLKLNIYDILSQIVFGKYDSGNATLAIVTDVIAVVASVVISLVTYFLTAWIIHKFIHPKKNRRGPNISFFTVLFSHKFHKIIANIIASWLFLICINDIVNGNEGTFPLEVVLQKIAALYFFIAILLAITYFLLALNKFYEKKFDFSNQYPINSYVKVVIVIIWVIGGVLAGCYLTRTSPWVFLTSLGAVSAVFLLIFKDTLLGIATSIRVTVSNILRVGDRIVIDSLGIDGTVLNVAINVVKIRSSDNTIINIPTYSLATQVIKNWRNVEEMQARLFKLLINIDAKTIRELSSEEIDRIKHNPELQSCIDANTLVYNNLTLYRSYLNTYLMNCPEINQEHLILVHHIDSTTSGMPLEVKAYTFDTTSKGQENIKSNLLEHFVVVMPEFGLSIWQS